MNIIEAIQQAENGKLITNNFLKMSNRFLEYRGEGRFFEHEISGLISRYNREVINFSTAEILSTGWEIVNINKVHINKEKLK